MFGYDCELAFNNTGFFMFNEANSVFVNSKFHGMFV